MTFTLHRRSFLIGLPLTAVAAPALAAGGFPSDSGVDLDVPYVPTPQSVVDAMLKLGTAGPNDIHYDLGSGDGRIVVTAARDYKVKKGVGIDLDPQRIKEATENAQKAGVTDRVTFTNADLFKTDFSEATLVTMYLLSSVNLQLRPKILDMRPGTRIVSHAFTMGEWEADQHETVEGRNIYFWRVPAKVAGVWTWQVGSDTYQANLRQEFQKVSGTLRAHGGEVPIENAVLSADSLKFTARPMKDGAAQAVAFDGRVTGGNASANVTVAGTASKVTAKLAN